MLITSGLRLFLHLGDTAVYRFQILDLKLIVNDLLITDRVYTSVHVHDIIVVEATQYVQDSVCLTDISQELIAQSLAFTRSFHQSGDIHDLYGGGDHSLRMFDFR